MILYSVHELHLCLFSSTAEVILALLLQHFLNILQLIYKPIFSWVYIFHNLNTHQHHMISHIHSMCFVSLVLDIKLNILTFNFLPTSETLNFVNGLLILLQLPLHLLILILKGEKIDPLLLTLTVGGLTLYSWLFIEIQLNKFTLVKVYKNPNPVKKYFLINPNTLLHYVILFH